MGEKLNTEACAKSIAKELVERIAMEDDVDLKAASETKIRIAIENALFKPVDGEFARGVEAAAQVARSHFFKSDERTLPVKGEPHEFYQLACMDIEDAIRALSPASVGMEKDNEDRSDG